MRSEQVIQGSVLSEKAYSLSEKNVYMLKVAREATKLDVVVALKRIFGVDVVSVNTSVVRCKIKRKSRGKNSPPIYVKLPNQKKAFVRLKAGQVLPLPAFNQDPKAADNAQAQV